MTDAPAPPSAPTRGRFDAAAIRPLLADWACVAIFVILGKENHGYEKGVTWFLTGVVAARGRRPRRRADHADLHRRHGVARPAARDDRDRGAWSAARCAR